MSSRIEEEDDEMHHYVNINFHGEEESKPALPPRPEKNNQYEKIREREEDLERIHRRSRELVRGEFEEGPVVQSFRPHRIPMRELEESGEGLRRRIRSPAREDYKDFSMTRCREPLSPCRLMEDGRSSSSESVWSDWSYPVCELGSVERRLLALEGDKQYLQLQMTAMSDKLHSHHDKVRDLQHSLHKKTEDLANTEDQVHMELLSRSSLETRKLELMTEISGLKLKQTELEKENIELRRKLQHLNLTDSLNNNSVDISSENEVIFERDLTPSRGATSYFQAGGVSSQWTGVRTKAGRRDPDLHF